MYLMQAALKSNQSSHSRGICPEPSHPVLPIAFPMHRLEKPPPYEEQYNEPHPRKWPILLQQQLPIDPHGGALVLPAVLAQPHAHVAHALQAVPPVQQVLDVLRHDLGHVAQLVVQLVQVRGCARVLVGLLGALDEGVELDEGVGAALWRKVLWRGVGSRELSRDVGEVGEGQLARVRLVAYCEEADGVGDCVAIAGLKRGKLEGFEEGQRRFLLYCMPCACYRGLWLGVFV